MVDESKSNHDKDPWIKERSYTNAKKNVLCPKCNVYLVTTEKKRAVSIGGVISVLPFFFGLQHAVFRDPVAGIFYMMVALIIGSIGRRKTVTACPLCRIERWSD